MKPYEQLIGHLKPRLAARGYRERRGAFGRQIGPNRVLCDVQAEPSRQVPHPRVTVNLGLVSAALRRFYGQPSLERVPSLLDVAWYERIGHVLPLRRDYWWELDEHDDRPIEEITTAIVEFGLPWIEARAHDEHLIELWKADADWHVTGMRRLMDLTGILAALGRQAELEEAVGEFRAFLEDPDRREMALEHLQRIETFVSAGSCLPGRLTRHHERRPSRSGTRDP